MTAQKDGGPAFPRHATQYIPQPPAYSSSGLAVRSGGPIGDLGAPGMSLRDYFAGQALAGMSIKDGGQLSVNDRARGHHRDVGRWYAEQAYVIADEMLKAREAKL